VLAASGAGDIVRFNEFLHFSLRESVDGLFENCACFCAVVFDKLVCAEAFVAFLTVK
jgi:hypothetical protein